MPGAVNQQEESTAQILALAAQGDGASVRCVLAAAQRFTTALAKHPLADFIRLNALLEVLRTDQQDCWLVVGTTAANRLPKTLVLLRQLDTRSRDNLSLAHNLCLFEPDARSSEVAFNRLVQLISAQSADPSTQVGVEADADTDNNANAEQTLAETQAALRLLFALLEQPAKQAWVGQVIQAVTNVLSLSRAQKASSSAPITTPNRLAALTPTELLLAFADDDTKLLSKAMIQQLGRQVLAILRDIVELKQATSLQTELAQPSASSMPRARG